MPDIKVYKWTAQASYFMGDCYELSKGFIDQESKVLDELVRAVLAQLYLSCHLTGESVYLLLRAEKEWDASILERAILEGSTRFAFIAHGSKEEMLKKCQEFWLDVPNTYVVSHHTHATSAADVLKDKPFRPLKELILPEKIAEDISQKMSKKDRKALQQKWSFQEILKYFSKHPDSKFQMYKSLSFGYGMSSHLIHKDGDGIGMEWERRQRSDPEREAVTYAHAARLISNVKNFSWLNSMYLHKICGADLASLYQVLEKYSSLSEELDEANKHFEHIEYGEETRTAPL